MPKIVRRKPRRSVSMEDLEAQAVKFQRAVDPPVFASREEAMREAHKSPPGALLRYNESGPSFWSRYWAVILGGAALGALCAAGALRGL